MPPHNLKSRVAEIRDATGVVRRRVSRYVALARVILPDIFLRYRWIIARIIMGAAAGLGLTTAALGGILVYTRLLESGESWTFADVTIDPSSSPSMLVGVMLSVGAMLLISSSLQFYADRKTSDLGRFYGVYCAERVLNLTSRYLHASAWRGDALNQPRIRKTATDSLICARTALEIAKMLPMIMRFVAYAMFMVYVDFLVTMVVGVIMVFSSYLFHNLSIQAADTLQERHMKGADMGKSMKDLFGLFAHRPTATPPDHRLFHSAARTNGFDWYYQAFFYTQVVDSKGLRVNTIILAVVIISVGLIKGQEIVGTGIGVADLAIFLLAARLTISNFGAVANSAVQVNQFFPILSNYFRTVELLRANGGDEHGRGERNGDEGHVPAIRFPLRLTFDCLGNSPADHAADFGPGARLALVSPGKDNASHFTALAVLGGITHDCGAALVPPGACRVVPDNPAGTGVSFRELAGLAEDCPRDDLLDGLRAAGVPESSLVTIPEDLDAIMGETENADPDASVIWAGRLFAAGETRHPLIFISNRALRGLGQRVTEYFLDSRLHDRVIVICYQSKNKQTAEKVAAQVGAHGESACLLHDGEAITGYLGVDDLRADASLIENLGGGQTGSGSGAGMQGMDDDL